MIRLLVVIVILSQKLGPAWLLKPGKKKWLLKSKESAVITNLAFLSWIQTGSVCVKFTINFDGIFSNASIGIDPVES